MGNGVGFVPQPPRPRPSKTHGVPHRDHVGLIWNHRRFSEWESGTTVLESSTWPCRWSIRTA